MNDKARAIQAFEDFKGERPAKLRRARLPDQDVTGWQMGPMVGAAYEARRDGKVQRYFHEFKKSARPNLVASADGRQLYIEGGKYEVTDRGIEDMPNLFVVNPSPRSGRKASRKGTSMRRARRSSSRKRRSRVAVFTTNPRRRRRTGRARARRSAVFARNPVRRRRRRGVSVYRRNPSRRRRAVARRSYRRNPSVSAGVGKLSSLILPAIFIGAGAVGSEIITGYLPIPVSWKVGNMRHVVKAGVGVAAGLVIAKLFRKKKLGYYVAAGAVAIAAHDIIKSVMAARLPNVQGLQGLGQYGRALPMNTFGQYGRPLRSQFGYVNPATVARFGGDGSLPNARQPGGEMNFAA